MVLRRKSTRKAPGQIAPMGDLTEIVIQEIDSAPLYQVHAGELHYLPDLVPVLGPVARVGALLTHGFRFTRATDAHGQTVLEQLRAVRTKLERRMEKVLETGHLEVERGPVISMMITAIHGHESRQEPYVMLFLFCQFLFHTASLSCLRSRYNTAHW